VDDLFRHVGAQVTEGGAIRHLASQLPRIEALLIPIVSGIARENKRDRFDFLIQC
jgi:hypothetical protein